MTESSLYPSAVSGSIPLSSVVPTFLYPKSRQFPFDEVAEQIVRALEARSWDVPGLEIEFDQYGHGHEKYRFLREIRGVDFKLRFGRPQGLLTNGKYNDVAALTELIIEQRELSIYEDESGPTLEVYVGSDWETDRNWFFNSAKVNSKLSGEPRRYLRYSGSASPSGKYYYAGQRRPYLVHDDDLGREYSPQNDEPHHYLTATVFEEMRDWLTANVLAVIESFPEQEQSQSAAQFWVPFPTDKFPNLFTLVEGKDTERIILGLQDPNRLEPLQRFALNNGGKRLLPYTVGRDDTLAEIVHDGFLYCVPGTIDRLQSWSELKSGAAVKYMPYRLEWAVPLQLKWANEVYVIDLAGQEDYRREVFANPHKSQMTDDEYAEYQRIPARTLVSILDYDGSYQQPVVLVRREIDFDEVGEPISSKSFASK